MKKHIALIGMAGNVKKAIATKLCSQLGMMLFDCQDFVEYENCMTSQEMVQKVNVTFFKNKISKVIKQLGDLENTVFCSCDLAVMSVADLEVLLKNCYVIRLYAKTKTIQSKYSKIMPIHPLLAGENLDKLNIQSQKRYASRCDFSLEIGKGSVDDAIDKILEFLKTC